MKEVVFFNECIQLIILCDIDIVNHALKLSVNQKEETRIECCIFKNKTSFVYFYLSVVVDIGNTSSNGKIFCNKAIRHLNLRRILNIEYTSLVSIISDKITILKQSIDRLIISKYNWSSSGWIIFNEFAIVCAHYWIRCQLNESIISRKIWYKVCIVHVKIKRILFIWTSWL